MGGFQPKQQHEQWMEYFGELDSAWVWLGAGVLGREPREPGVCEGSGAWKIKNVRKNNYIDSV